MTEYKIQMQCDGRIFRGTPTEIVTAMRSLAFIDPMTLDEYINWVENEALRMEEIRLSVRGGTTAERAESLIRTMCDSGLAHYLN